MKEFDVAVVRELNVDIILSGLEGMPELGQETLAQDALLALGSSSAIFAHNLSRLGGKVAFCGKAGDDIYGRYVVQSLAAAGVDTSAITLDNRVRTGMTVSITHPRDRALITYRGAMEHLSAEHEEALRISGVACLRDAGPKLARLAGLVIIKRGIDGAVAWEGADSLSARGYKADVIDTTGAGDSFNAGFIYKFLAGCPLEECLMFGAACGAIACTYLGGASGLPTLSDVEEFRRTHEQLSA